MALGIVSHGICRIALLYLETYNCVLKTDIGIKQMRARLVNLSQKPFAICKFSNYKNGIYLLKSFVAPSQLWSNAFYQFAVDVLSYCR